MDKEERILLVSQRRHQKFDRRERNKRRDTERRNFLTGKRPIRNARMCGLGSRDKHLYVGMVRRKDRVSLVGHVLSELLGIYPHRKTRHRRQDFWRMKSFKNLGEFRRYGIHTHKKFSYPYVFYWERPGDGEVYLPHLKMMVTLTGLRSKS